MIHPFKFSLIVCALGIVPALAAADEPSVREWTKNRIQTGLVDRLSAKEGDGPRFSRSRQAPTARRIRVVSSTLSKDAQGRAFATYELDVRYGDDWQLDVVGCVYRASGEIFVKLGEEYRPAEVLLGEDKAPVKGACETNGAS